ncbi:MAG: hypothetical protein KGP01_07030 [Actinomycetales bacterium]|nr:hypothetical protein [Actinomycetales bacterium]
MRASASLRLMSRWVGLQARVHDQRGDVPGWVLVTVMTAGLVTAIWLVADTQLKAVLERAMASLSAK